MDDYSRKCTYGEIKQTLSVKSGSRFCVVPYDDIYLIERATRKIAIHTTNGTLTCYESLEAILKKVENIGIFVRCHRSYIINKQKVKEIDFKDNKIIFVNGKHCFVGKTYKKTISSLLF